MKHRKASISLVLGLALTLALAVLWVVGSGSSTVLAAPAAGAPADPDVTLYVCASGCDHASIQAAVDAANPGDTIKVAGGHYTGVQTREGITQSVYISKTVNIYGSYTPPDWTSSNPTNPTIVDALGQGRVFVIDGTAGGVGVILQRLNITGGDATGQGGGPWGYEGAGGGIYVEGANLSMEYCKIYDNLASSAGWGGGGGMYVYTTTSAALVMNEIYNNTASTSDFGEGGGLALSQCDATVVANSIHHNYANTNDSGLGGGIYMEAGSSFFNRNRILHNVASPTGTGGGGGIWFGLEDDSMLVNTVIANNVVGSGAQGSGVASEWSYPSFRQTTIQGNTGGAGAGVEAFFNSNVGMTNTIVASQTTGISVEVGSEAGIDGVLWFNNGANTGGGGTTNLSNQNAGNPLFAADGYHLQFGSAAVEVGTDSGTIDDVDGQIRPFGLGYDLGADELVVEIEPVDPLLGTTLIYTDTQGTTTTLEIPPGAVLQSVSIVYTPIPSPTRPLYPSWQSSDVVFFLDAYQGFQLLPGFTFQKPVSLTVHYTDYDIAGLDESTLRFYYWDGYEWVDGSTTCSPWSDYARDPANNLLSLPICHLSEWHMGGALIGGPGLRIYLPLVMRAAP